jgi:hypothetical protein
MLLGAALAFVAGAMRRQPVAVAAYAPAAAAFLVTRFYSYDPYYAPSLRRHSEVGNVAPVWVWLSAAAAVAVGALTVAVRRAGALATGGAMVPMTLAVGIGH